MAIFGADRSSEVEALKLQLQDSETKRKALSVAFTAEKKRADALASELQIAQASLQSAKQSVEKARKRQKASVERANRFKSKIESITNENDS